MSSLTFNCEALKTLEDAYSLINKAGYTATLVACGWAGAVLDKVTRASGQEQCSKSSKTPKKLKGDQPTDKPTDRHSGI